MLRPASWILAEGINAGGISYFELPEFGAVGNAHVTSIGPCPEIEPDDGTGRNVITARFIHQSADNLFDLKIAGQSEATGVTGNHPYWSEDRQAFVEAASLMPGERVRTVNGLAKVVSLSKRPSNETVYNLEIHREHVYHVGTAGTLVHNSYLDAAERLRLNKIAGKVGEKFLNNTFGGMPNAFRRTPKGARFIDNLADGIAMESKVGRTSLTKFVKTQVEKDAELLQDLGAGIRKVEWHFFDGKTGAGPTKPLFEALEEAGISIFTH